MCAIAWITVNRLYPFVSLVFQQSSATVLPEQQRNNRMKRFLLLLTGQSISMVGSGLTTFAIGIWFYRETGSVTRFSLLFLAGMLPRTIVAPLLGPVVDSWNRRFLMMISDVAGAACTSSLLVLLWTGKMRVWSVCLIIAVGRIFESLRALAFTATFPQLLRRQELGRGNGMLQGMYAGAQTVAPFLSALLLAAFGLHWLLLADLFSFIPSLASLWMVTIPGQVTTEQSHSFRWEDVISGWNYIFQHSGLLLLLIFLTLSNFYLGFATVLSVPLVLSFGSVKSVGIVESMASIGYLTGSVLMGIWGGGKRRTHALLWFNLLESLCLVLTGIWRNVWIVCCATFGIFFCSALIAANIQVIWQNKTPVFMQGRVFSVRMALSWAIAPLAYILAGPLTDKVFEPMFSRRSTLATIVGPFIGTGHGRGIGFVFVLIGIVDCLAALIFLLAPHVRDIEQRLPDAVMDPDM